MNIKLRLQNPATLIPIITTLIALIYMILSIFGITPGVSQDDLTNTIVAIVLAIFDLLSLFGIIVDPTTDGIKDSEAAKEYTSPKKKEEA